MKDYQQMTPAEQGIMDYLQAYSYYRVNSKTKKGQEMTDTERVLEEIAYLGGLIGDYQFVGTELPKEENRLDNEPQDNDGFLPF